MLQRPIYQTTLAVLTLAAFAGAIVLIVAPGPPPGVEVVSPPDSPAADVANDSSATLAGASTGGRININSANAQELTALDGIGPVLAERIVEYREANGPFVRTDQLMSVERIGPATYERLRGSVTVGD